MEQFKRLVIVGILGLIIVAGFLGAMILMFDFAKPFMLGMLQGGKARPLGLVVIGLVAWGIGILFAHWTLLAIKSGSVK